MIYAPYEPKQEQETSKTKLQVKMVYFPSNVFKNITSYFKPLYPTRPHPVARMFESELGVWALALRCTPDDDLRTLWKLHYDFFEPRFPCYSQYDPTMIYKQRFAGAKMGWTHKRARYNSIPIIVSHTDLYGKTKCYFHHHWTGTRTQEIKNYLKANGVRGYSKKKKAELIAMCMSF